MKKVFIFLVLATVAYFGYQSYSSTHPQQSFPDDQADLIFFWGDGCPHCEKVKQYIKDNQIDSKIKIASKEVYYNKTNQNLLTETVKNCPEIDTSQGIGVPLGYSNSDKICLYGDQPIIDWMAKQ